ncbi:MAG: glycoside hydrolase family 30 beta sandwich domain-containing protein [Candidatus Acidiferrales bacterium]
MGTPDKRGRPNIGQFSCGGLVTIDSRTKEIARSGQYWASAHCSRVVRRGAHRFHSQSSAVDLQHVGLQNPDGQQVLVVTNAGPATTIELRLANRTAPISLKGNSITTLAWR